jgi:hypothetical protein
VREIKFRAFDEGNKVMHFDFQFMRSGSDGNDWILFKSDKNKEISDWYNNPYFAQQIKIMQYTGLKDTNGKEIYEGDIIKYMGFEVLDGKQIRPTRHFTISSENFIRGCYALFCLMDCNGTCEVIGNIHENSDLIKK